MLGHDQARERGDAPTARTFANFFEWVMSLPWVVERPYGLASSDVRCFAVDCEPLGRRQVWLITGMQRHGDHDGLGVAVVVPAEVAAELEELGWGEALAPMPACHVLVTEHPDSPARRPELEALVLTAYSCAM